MTFDSNSAWQHAAAAIRANREVVFALSGVFFLLPSLAFSLLFPQPEPPAGADEAAMLKFASAYYAQALPAMIPLIILQAAGMLGLLTLLTDRTRPTVGQAIRTGFTALLPFLAAQILAALALMLLLVAVTVVLGLTGSKTIAGAGTMLVLVAALYVWVRISLTAPVIAVEGVRNPVAALKRSWALTRGQALRMFLFYFLIVLVFTIVLAIVLALAGIVLALVLPANLATIVGAVISAGLGSAMMLMLVAALAATHGQLSGNAAEPAGLQFD